MRRPAGRQAPPQEPLPELSSAARAFVTRACYFGVDQFLTDGLISVGCEASGGCEGSRRCVPCLERGTRSLSGGTTPALPTPPWSLHLLCEFLVKPLSPSSTDGAAWRRSSGTARERSRAREDCLWEAPIAVIDATHTSSSTPPIPGIPHCHGRTTSSDLTPSPIWQGDHGSDCN